MSQSTRYRQLKDETATAYYDPRWTYARRWRARVGLPRLTAEAAATEASSLLRSINLSTHRNEPELRELLEDAREAASEYAVAAARANWARFEGKLPPRP